VRDENPLDDDSPFVSSEDRRKRRRQLREWSPLELRSKNTVTDLPTGVVRMQRTRRHRLSSTAAEMIAQKQHYDKQAKKRLRRLAATESDIHLMKRSKEIEPVHAVAFSSTGTLLVCNRTSLITLTQPVHLTTTWGGRNLIDNEQDMESELLHFNSSRQAAEIGLAVW
jgi:hypothetical protein